MEPNKLENQIREKLLGREIKPSVNSWDRLDAMLSVQEEKKNRKVFPWLSVAASFLVLMGLGYFFMNQNQEKEIDLKSQPSVVEVNSETIKTESHQTTESIEKKSVADNVEYTDSKSIAEKKSNSVKNKLQIIGEKQEQQIASSEVSPMKQENIVEQQKSVLSQKQEVDTESLLAQVEQSKTTPKAKVKVDAKDLLSQVDGEIELTFRQKVMRTIKKNYQETKVAISTRNQESSSNH
ncbi:MAG TPA: hypothetical protein VJL37_07870 [Flavobacterium sp.]|nr:hypothetical protein [Flavobacterium sp.]